MDMTNILLEPGVVGFVRGGVVVDVGGRWKYIAMNCQSSDQL